MSDEKIFDVPLEPGEWKDKATEDELSNGKGDDEDEQQSSS